MNWTETGALIREARKQLGLTQAELAKTLGMSRATISQVENGVVVELGARKLSQLCDRLGLEVVVQPRQRRLTLHEAYAKNKAEREAAFKETDNVLARMKDDDARRSDHG